MSLKDNNLLNMILVMVIGLIVCTAKPVNAQVASVVNIFDTTIFGSSDPSGLTFFPDTGNLLLADSEVEETPFFTGVNLFEVTPSGTVLATYSTLGFSREPTGVTFNTFTGTIFITDDDQGKVFEVNSTNPEEVLSSFSTRIFGGTDAEGITFDPTTGNLFVVDGFNSMVFEFTVSGSLVSSFLQPDQIRDAEGIIFERCSGNLFVVSGPDKRFIFEVTTRGEMVNIIDIQGVIRPTGKGITFAPSSDPNDDPNIFHVYVADYGNDEVNDGQLFEIFLGGSTGCTGTRPQIDSGPTATPNPLFEDETAQLSVTASDPNGDPLTFSWAVESGEGTISGTGAMVTYMPPAVTAQQVFTVTVTVSDGQGGTATGTVDVTVLPVGGGPGGVVIHEETQTGGASSVNTVTTSASLTGVSGDLYLAAISYKPNRTVLDVLGLGLLWTEVISQCGGRSATGVSVWRAQGSPSGNGVVTATLSSAPKNAVIAVTRYSGVGAIGNVQSANTNGVAGACSGGTDLNSYSFNLTTRVSNAVVYGAVAIRNRTHTPGAGYTERVEVSQGTSGGRAGIAVEDQTVTSPSAVTVDGSFNNTVDWAVVAVEIWPGAVSSLPSITSFTPTSGPVDTGVTITGNNFTGASQVDFNGTLDPGFSVVSDTEIQATVPAGATTGPISVTTAEGTGISATDFTVTTPGGGGDVIFEEVQAGGSTASTTVTTAASLTAADGHLYLAAISFKPNRTVLNVLGLGLVWTEVISQCGGRSATGVSVWRAQGSPSGDGVVTATLSSAPKNAVIAVTRYSGVGAIGNVQSANTNGVAGACSGGVDNGAYSFNLTTTVDNAVVYGAVGMRNRTHTPGAGYTEQVEVRQGTGGAVASIAVQDQTFGSAATVTVDGSFNSTVDWAVVAVEIRP